MTVEGLEVNGKKFAGLRKITAQCPFCKESTEIDLAALVKEKEGKRIVCLACGKDAFEVKKIQIGPKKLEQASLVPEEPAKEAPFEINIKIGAANGKLELKEVDGVPVEQPKPVLAFKVLDPFQALTDEKYCTLNDGGIKQIGWESGRGMIVGKISAGQAWKDDDGEPIGELDIIPINGKEALTIQFDGARFLAIESISPAFGKDKKKAREFLLSGSTKQEPWKAWGQKPIKIRVDLDSLTLTSLSTRRFQCHYVPDLMPALKKIGEFDASQMPGDGHGGIAYWPMINVPGAMISITVDIGELDEGKEGIKIFASGYWEVDECPMAWNIRHRGCSIRHQGLQRMGQGLKEAIELGRMVPQALEDARVSGLDLEMIKKILAWLVASKWLTRQEKIIGLTAMESKNPITVADLFRLIPYLGSKGGEDARIDGALGELIWQFTDKPRWAKFIRGLAEQKAPEKPEALPVQAKKEDEDLTGLE